MKRILLPLLAVFLLPIASFGQTSLTGRWIPGLAAARPTCSASFNATTANNGDVYDDIDDAGVFKCLSGTWSAISSGGGGTVYPGAGVALSTGSAWNTSLQVGTNANNLVQLNAFSQLPAVSAALLTNFPTLNQNSTGTSGGLLGCITATAGSVCYWNGAAWTVFAGNNSGTQFFSENSSGVPSWSSSAGGVPTETQYCGPYYATTTTFGCISAPTGNGLYLYGWNVVGGVAVAPVAGQVGLGGRSITGATTSATVAFSDNGTVISHDKAASGTVNPITLPTATTLGNPGFVFFYSNHSAQTDVLTPTTWTVQVGTAAAAATYSIPPGQFCRFKVDPNSATNWLGDCVTSVSGTTTIANGSLALSTGAISSGACTSAQTATATGALATDGLITNFGADPTATTGYQGSANGMLTIIPYLTSNTFNAKVCNNTASSITPGAVTLQFRVVR